MKQLNTIEQLRTMLPQVQGVDIALLYGSFGRNEATPNSDIDIQLVVDPAFQPRNLIDALDKSFQNEIKFIREVALRNKVVAYFNAQPKIEFAIHTKIDEIDRNYLGSEIPDIDYTILYEKCLTKYDIGGYLHRLVKDHTKNIALEQNEKHVAELIEKFLYEFESCSDKHRRSDGYQFYFFYNIALQVAIQLNHLSKGFRKFNFLPKYFIASVLARDEQELFYQLKGTLFLPEANQQKRKLLDFFYSSIQTITSSKRQEEVKQFCEWVYNRDFLWNFRDISTHNPKIKGGIVFRTATLSLFQNEKYFDDLIYEKQIKTVIDLRSDKEIEELPYTDATQTKFNYVRTPLDPWNQPDWYIKNYHHGTDEEIAYRFFAIGCNDKIKTALEAIINENNGSVAVHCFAGKDRTGIFISLLHLLAETSIETIYADYLASEVDVQLHRLNIVLDIIKEKGGIEPYLNWCGLSEHQISILKQKLLN